MSRSARATVATTVLVGVLCAAAGKPKRKPPPPPEVPSAAGLPSNPSVASLRLTAMLTLYELDASPEQLRRVRTAAESPGVADGHDRPGEKGSDKLAKAMAELRDALVEPTVDDQKVAAAHSALADAAGEADPPLDDAVHPPAAARAKAAELAKLFSAGQLAAFVAAHADQVVGPAERLAAGVADVRDAADPAAVDAAIRDVSTEVGQLAAGPDGAAVAAKAADWLRANKSAADDTPDARAKLEASAKAAVGDVPPADVLGHWFEDEMAQLIANPQASAATAALAARPKEKTP